MPLAEAIRRVSRSLAWLKVEHEGGDEGYGTAFVVGAAGEIVTAAHLLRDARRVEATIVGTHVPMPCAIADTDVQSDLALLKAEARDLSPVALRRAGPVPLGTDVAFVGFPHADIFQPPLVMAMRGIVGNRYRLGPTEYYVVDASAAEGMSGSPLFLAASGEVIGVIGGRFDPGRTRAKLRGENEAALRGRPAERTNIAFAASVEYVLALLARHP